MRIRGLERGLGELEAVAPVRATPPERAFGVGGVGDPLTVAGEFDGVRRDPREIRNELAGETIVADQLTAFFLAHREDLPAVATRHRG